MEKFEKVQIGNDEAVILVPKLEGKLAIVDLETIKRLASNLPKVPFETLKQEIIEKLIGSENLEDVVFHMENELKFHKSINMIQNFQY